jgi:hypothetical protein
MPGLIVEMKGGGEIARWLGDMPKRLANKLVGGTLKAAGAPMLAAMRANIHDRTGTLASGLRIRTKVDGMRFTCLVQSSVQRQAFFAKRQSSSYAKWAAGDTSGYDVYYGPWVESGHLIGKRPKGGLSLHTVGYTPAGKAIRRYNNDEVADNRGSVPEHPFVRPAYDRNEAQAIETIETGIDQGISE